MNSSVLYYTTRDSSITSSPPLSEQVEEVVSAIIIEQSIESGAKPFKPQEPIKLHEWISHGKQPQTGWVKAQIKRPAPAFSLKTVNKKSIGPGTLKGKVVVLCFLDDWWCEPCSRVISYLEDLKRTMPQKPVEFLIMLKDSKRDKAQRRENLKRSNLTFLTWNQQVLKQFGIPTYPYICIMDSEGNIRSEKISLPYEQTGLSTDFKASLQDQLTWLLGEAAGKK